MSSEFLLEVGCEEIPARAMGPVLEELKKKFGVLLGGHKLSFDAIQTLGSARRLVVHVAGLAELQEKETVTTLGPPQKIAFNDGEPSRALIGFARKSGLEIDDLRVFDTERGKYMGFESEAGGRTASEILAERIPPLIESLTFPKTMYWDDSRREFARPIRWVVALLGSAVVPFDLYGVPSGSTSAGHWTLGSQTVPVRDFDNYLKRLEANFVLVSQESRRDKIRGELAAACESLDGRMIPDEDLLDEVVYINEYPTVVVGGFEKRFLDLPREVLITAMREHQKYFAVETVDGTLLPNFLGVMNTKGDPRGSIRKGHERVLKARLSDALFFWDADGRRTLADRVDGLASVTFHRKLGSYKDKIDRMSGLANTVNVLTGAAVPPETLESVVAWSKSDLITGLVGEFAGLQGIAGGLYARREGAGDEVWKAIYDQYRPAGLDDRSPETASGAVLALTDRLDTVFGCFFGRTHSERLGRSARASPADAGHRQDTAGSRTAVFAGCRNRGRSADGRDGGRTVSRFLPRSIEIHAWQDGICLRRSERGRGDGFGQSNESAEACAGAARGARKPGSDRDRDRVQEDQEHSEAGGRAVGSR